MTFIYLCKKFDTKLNISEIEGKKYETHVSTYTLSHISHLCDLIHDPSTILYFS